MMNPEQLNAIKERVANATPGPWESGQIEGEKSYCVIDNDSFIGKGMLRKDSEFIAHAQEDVPALVTEVERLKADRERWFKRESSLQKEIERLQAIEIESDSKLCEQKKGIELLRKALEKVMEVEAPIMEGWETSVYEIARKALGGEVHD
ncbi:hypothetical protein [Lysinibacillus sp. NPDC093216]|uniref:hypothetical protein n=1 Tax=Lysinibacillus sp. NPDC093216 TaxID=3390576 RepID=UPI003D06D99F